MAAVGALRAKRGTYGIRTFQWHSDFIDTYGGVLEEKAPFLPKAVITTATSPLWSLVRSIARRCDATLVASAWQVGKLAAHGVPNVVHRPFGIERDVFTADRASAEGRRSLLKLVGREDAFVCVGIGRFAIEKRWDLVIDAFKAFRAGGRENAVLVLFGDGPERKRMQERAGDAPVYFPGFSKDRIELATHMANADMLVHGCPFETFGLSIAEAMSCGLPAVVPDDGGASEMHDPESGERYAANDAESCTEAMIRLFDRICLNTRGLRTSASRAASRLPTVRQHFSEQLDLYGTLLNRRPNAK
jgi:alpha-1,6-mannosyltransferase